MARPTPTIQIPIRRARGTDLDALLTLEQRSFHSDRMSRAQFRRHLDSDSVRILVASDHQQQLLGAAVVFFRKGAGIARLYSLATDPRARGKGVGRSLLHAVDVAARQRGCRAVRLEVRTDNTAAIQLYERHGYQCIGRYPHYYEDGADAWRYEQPLT